MTDTINLAAQDVTGVTPLGGRTVTTLKQYLTNNAVLNAKDHGAVGDGASRPLSTLFASLPLAQVVYPAATALTDELDDVAAQKAVNAAEALGWGYVHIPLGTYLKRDSLTVKNHRVHVTGDGLYATQLLFLPATAKAVIKIQHANPALVIAQCSVTNLTFLGHASASAVQKIGIDAWDTSGLLVHAVSSQSWTGNSGSTATPSTFMRTNGREATTVNFVFADADRPFWLRANPNSASLDADSFTFTDCYCTVRAASEASYELDSQIGVFNLTIGGRQAWVQGKYGIHWASAGAMRAVAQNIVISNGRFEQATVAGGAAIYWTGGTNNLTLISCGLGGVVNANIGFYVRNTAYPYLLGCSYAGTSGVAIDADGTAAGINTLAWQSCIWSAGATATLVGLLPVLEYPKHVSGAPLPPSASYITTAAALPAIKLNGSPLDRWQGTLANGGSFTLYLSATGATKVAIVQVAMCEIGGTNKSEYGHFLIANTLAGTKKLSDSTTNVVLGNVAGNLCLLWTSLSSIQVINQLGVSVECIIGTEYRPG